VEALASEKEMFKSPIPTQRILVVEDDKPIADMLTMMLEMEGYGVDWAPSAKTAMHFLTHQRLERDGGSTETLPQHHALILLDLQLPDMDGSDFVHQLNTAGTLLPPVIVLSAKRNQAVQDAATRINAAGVLTKPFQMDALLQQIQHILS
jgi:DNA-binding response OmpR family regulator